MQLIISLLKLEQGHSSEREAEKLGNLVERIRIFSSVHSRLYQQEDMSEIDFAEHLKDNLQTLIKAYNIKKSDIVLKLEITHHLFKLEQAITCGLLFNERYSSKIAR